MNATEKKLIAKLFDLPKEATPGFCLQVAHKGRKIIDVEWGKTAIFYDLASLTKIIFTTTQWMILQNERILNVDRKIQNYIPWYSYSTTGRKLLSHAAGNEWWHPFYKNLTPLKSSYEKKQTLRKMLRELQPKVSSKAVYSDIDFLLLGCILEETVEKPLNEQWDIFLERHLPGNRIHFNKNNKPVYTKATYAPTEKCNWRGRTLQGEVHDENTWALNGVSAQAGLFGSVTDVMEWGLWLRHVLFYGDRHLSRETTHMFLKRAFSPAKGDWALGFMMPTKGAASCGAYFSPKSVGHTGFTGTSFWMDPVSDIIVVLLSNRIYPDRKNEEFRKWRPRIHDAVFESITNR